MSPRVLVIVAMVAAVGACSGSDGPDLVGAPEGQRVEGAEASSAFTRWGSMDAISAFRAAGLEADSPRPMTRDDYGLAPMLAEGTRFLIPSLADEWSEDVGGRVLSFANEEDLDRTREFYVGLGRESAVFFSHVFVKDNLLVQINGDLADDRAQQYEAALMSLGG